MSLTVLQAPGLIKTYAITRTQMKAVGPDSLAGTYAYQGDASVLVVIERVAGNQFRITCPREHWAGMGVAGNDYLRGAFQMEDHPEVAGNLRGAVSFLQIDFGLADRFFPRSKFGFFDSGDKMAGKTLVRHKERTEPAHAGDGR